MDFEGSFDLTEEPIAWLLATKKGGNDSKDIADAPCSTAGAPNGQSRLKKAQADADTGPFSAVRRI
ncbi:MAG: hypothetical protein WEK74_05680 [Hydrogenophaga sp.]